jgi:alkylated DNA repair dioxygenase AlkB
LDKNSSLIKADNLSVEYIENFFDFDQSQLYMKHLTNDIKWKREKIRMWGREIITKKRIAWYADEGKSYTYSGSTFHPDQWNELLLEIKKHVEQYIKFQFNSVLLNEYPNGKVGMGWHSDDERELGIDPIIASLSFGANRDFIFKHKTDKSFENIKIHLKSGSLLLMLGSTQHHWKHSLPKRLKVREPRINLTFRKIL